MAACRWGFSLPVSAIATVLHSSTSGWQKGIERIAKIFLPFLFSILLLMLISAARMEGFGESLAFIFIPHFGELEPAGILEALGHAFFHPLPGDGGHDHLRLLPGAAAVHRESAGIILLLDTIIGLVAATHHVRR